MTYQKKRKNLVDMPTLQLIVYTVIGLKKNALTLSKPCFGEKNIICQIK